MLCTFTYQKTLRAELQASVRWALPAARQFGQASVVIPRNRADAYTFTALGEYIREGGGSLVTISHGSAGLWTGIVTEIKFAAQGAVVTAWQDTILTSIRPVSTARSFASVTAGLIVRAAVQDAIAGLGADVLRLGTVMEAAPIIPTYTFRGQALADVLADMVAATGHDWWIADGALNWGPPRGSLYDRLLCDDGDLTRPEAVINITDSASEVRAADGYGRVTVLTNGDNLGDHLWQRVVLTSSPSASSVVAGMEGVAALNGRRGSSLSLRLRLKQTNR